MKRHQPTLPWPRSADDGTPLGIDLAAKALDIRRIVIAGFRTVCMRGHVEDLVQQACLAILRRNRMPSAFDPRDGAFSHYVHIVAACTLSNMLESERRHPAAPDDDFDAEADELGADDRIAAAEALYPPTPPLWRLALDARAVGGPQLALFGSSVLAPCVSEPDLPPATPLSRLALDPWAGNGLQVDLLGASATAPHVPELPPAATPEPAIATSGPTPGPTMPRRSGVRPRNLDLFDAEPIAGQTGPSAPCRRAGGVASAPGEAEEEQRAIPSKVA